MDIIYKESKVRQIFFKKNFKQKSSYKNHFFILVIIFIVNLAKIDTFIKENNKIQVLVEVSDLGNVEIILKIQIKRIRLLSNFLL